MTLLGTLYHWTDLDEAHLVVQLPRKTSRRIDFSSTCVSTCRAPIQAALAVNFLGPCAAARTRTNRFLNARCSTYMTAPHFLSLKTEKCDTTCTSPAAGRSGTHSGPGNTTRQICTLRRGGHVPKAPPVRVLTGQPLTSCVRVRPAPLTCPAAPE